MEDSHSYTEKILEKSLASNFKYKAILKTKSYFRIISKQQIENNIINSLNTGAQNKYKN